MKITKRKTIQGADAQRYTRTAWSAASSTLPLSMFTIYLSLDSGIDTTTTTRQIT